jgi:DNA polymerase III subunit gamma/tau
VLLPGADHSTDGLMARLERLERRMTISGGEPSAPTPPAAEPAPVPPAPPPAAEPTTSQPTRAAGSPPVHQAAAGATPLPETPPATASTGSTLTLVDVRRLWPDIVEATKQRRRLTWIYLTQQAQVVTVDDATLTLGFANAGARESFENGGSAEIVRQAAIDVVGHDWRVETIVDPGADPEGAPPPVRTPEPEPAAPPRPDGHRHGSPPSSKTGTPATPARAHQPEPPPDPDGGARPDDTDAETSGLDSTQLLQEALGAQVIEEIPHQ